MLYMHSPVHECTVTLTVTIVTKSQFDLQVSLAMLKGETVVAVCVCQMCMYFCILEGSGVHRLKVAV